MQVYMLYYVSPDNFVPSPKLPIAVFQNLDDAIEAAGKQDGYGYGKDWFVKEVPLFGGRYKEDKDTQAPVIKVRVGDKIQVESSQFFVEHYSETLGEPPAAYLKSVAELAEENRSE